RGRPRHIPPAGGDVPEGYTGWLAATFSNGRRRTHRFIAPRTPKELGKRRWTEAEYELIDRLALKYGPYSSVRISREWAGTFRTYNAIQHVLRVRAAAMKQR
ncbi:unnamed protein product, partial [Phaeothamnion confervicola]